MFNNLANISVSTISFGQELRHFVQLQSSGKQKNMV